MCLYIYIYTATRNEVSVSPATYLITEMRYVAGLTLTSFYNHFKIILKSFKDNSKIILRSL